MPVIVRALRIGLALAALTMSPAIFAGETLPVSGTEAPARAKVTGFASTAVSNQARQLAAWVVTSGDNQALPFLIIDKVNARVFGFDPAGVLRGAAPVLLGLARGDISPPGIGSRALAKIAPGERITPAGRFVAGLGHNLAGQDILWVDYDAAISLHRVVTGKVSERRLQRLATTSTGDNRISYGCINVPAGFFDSIVLPIFAGTPGIVYILPERRSLQEVFATANHILDATPQP